MTPLRWETPAPDEGVVGPTARLLGKVIHQERVGAMILLRLRVPGWSNALPGQFVMLQAEGSALFLPRAFSVHEQEGGDIAFLIAPVGPGTEELSQLDIGDRAFVLGPLGYGFEQALPQLSSRRAYWREAAPLEAGRARRVVVAAGGVGAAPFVLLLEEIAACRPRCATELLLLLGFRDDVQAEALHLFREPAELLHAAGVPFRMEVITEDGSLGRAGLVTTLLREELQAEDLVLACGAHAMCEAVWDLCLERKTTETWFSLEAGMACGIGSCQGCVLPLADGSLVKVCRQGPVFSGAQVFGDLRHPCTVPAPPEDAAAPDPL